MFSWHQILWISYYIADAAIMDFNHIFKWIKIPILFTSMWVTWPLSDNYLSNGCLNAVCQYMKRGYTWLNLVVLTQMMMRCLNRRRCEVSSLQKNKVSCKSVRPLHCILRFYTLRFYKILKSVGHILLRLFWFLMPFLFTAAVS